MSQMSFTPPSVAQPTSPISPIAASPMLAPGREILQVQRVTWPASGRFTDFVYLLRTYLDADGATYVTWELAEIRGAYDASCPPISPAEVMECSRPACQRVVPTRLATVCQLCGCEVCSRCARTTRLHDFPIIACVDCLDTPSLLVRVWRAMKRLCWS